MAKPLNLTPEQIQKIRDQRSKVSQRTLAKEFGVSHSMIGKLQRDDDTGFYSGTKRPPKGDSTSKPKKSKKTSRKGSKTLASKRADKIHSVGFPAPLELFPSETQAIARLKDGNRPLSAVECQALGLSGPIDNLYGVIDPEKFARSKASGGGTVAADIRQQEKIARQRIIAEREAEGKDWPTGPMEEDVYLGLCATLDADEAIPLALQQSDVLHPSLEEVY